MQKFIIVCPARTGSTALRMSLNRHPAISCNGEYYGQNRVTGWPEKGQITKEEALQVRRDNPKRFLEKYAFGEGEVCGFKLLYGQLLDLGFATTLGMIKSDRSIGIIHLWREDLCSRFISEKRFIKQLESRNAGKVQIGIRLSPNEMLHDCRNQLLAKRRVEALFGDRAVLPVLYERLAEAASEIQDFLGLAGRTPKIELAKEKLDYSNEAVVTVENADELRQTYDKWIARERERNK